MSLCKGRNSSLLPLFSTFNPDVAPYRYRLGVTDRDLECLDEAFTAGTLPALFGCWWRGNGDFFVRESSRGRREERRERRGGENSRSRKRRTLSFSVTLTQFELPSSRGWTAGRFAQWHARSLTLCSHHHPTVFGGAPTHQPQPGPHPHTRTLTRLTFFHCFTFDSPQTKSLRAARAQHSTLSPCFLLCDRQGSPPFPFSFLLIPKNLLNSLCQDGETVITSNALHSEVPRISF